MDLSSDNLNPIYVQVSEWLENEIIGGNIGADEHIYSQYQLADLFNINPATAAKGLSLLADDGILYKKRGLGMFVAPDARERLLEKRKGSKLKNIVLELVAEAGKLGVGERQLNELIAQAQKQFREGEKQ